MLRKHSALLNNQADPLDDKWICRRDAGAWKMGKLFRDEGVSGLHVQCPLSSQAQSGSARPLLQAALEGSLA